MSCEGVKEGGEVGSSLHVKIGKFHVRVWDRDGGFG